jgi:hypothetical protein
MTVSNTNYGAAPRSHSRHLRHRAFARLRHSQQFLCFLTEQGERLDSPADTPAAVFAKLTKYTSDQIKAAANIASLT